LLTKVTINKVELSQTYINDSKENGYNAIDYLHVEDMVIKWGLSEEVTMYSSSWEKSSGRLKSSEHNGHEEYIQQYHNVCHARLSGNNDPILICKFIPSENKAPNLFVAYISDHRQMFGYNYEKSDPKRMREIRNKNEEKLP
jgi:hypothetical protein